MPRARIATDVGFGSQASVQRRKLPVCPANRHVVALPEGKRWAKSRRFAGLSMRLSKDPADDLVGMSVETPAMAEHDMLRSPRANFCNGCFRASPLQE